MNAKPSRSRPNRLAPVLVVVSCLVALLLAVYVGGYFMFGRDQPQSPQWPNDDVVVRVFLTPWLCSVYRLAGMTESKMSGRSVELRSYDR